MNAILVFYAVLAVLLAIALVGARRVAWPVALMCMLGALGTSLIASGGFRDFQLLRFGVDIALLIGVTSIAAARRAHWPIAIAALQLTTVFGHVARMVVPNVWPLAYWVMTEWTAWPSLLLIAYGIYRERRAGIT